MAALLMGKVNFYMALQKVNIEWLTFQQVMV